MKSTIYRYRLKAFPKPPATRADIVLPERYQKTLDGRNFLLCDDGSEHRILLFSTENGQERLCTDQIISVDGLFCSCQRLFFVCFLVVVVLHNKCRLMAM